MSLAQDLMGLGENPLVAARLASGGVGPVTMTVTGTTSTTAGATPIFGQQYITSISTVSGGGWLMLPAPTQTTGTGPLIYDDYVIHNATGGSVTVSPPPGVTINIGGVAYVNTNGGAFTLATLKTLTIWTGPTTTQWFGLSA